MIISVRHLLIITILILIIVIIIRRILSKTAMLTNDNTLKSQPYSSSLDNHLYNIRTLYADTYVFENTEFAPTGIGKTIAVFASFLSVWFLQDIVNALRDNGIYNKSISDLRDQISYVNATVMQDEPFDYGEKYQDLHMPLSNGISSQVLFEDSPRPSTELSVALQTIFCSLPDVKVIIYYVGASPTECPPDTEGLPYDEAGLEVVVQFLIRALRDTKDNFDVLCSTLLFDCARMSYDFYGILNELMTNPTRPVSVVATVGTAMDTNTSFPAGFPNIINTGGVALTSPNTPIAYLNSHGGFFNITPVSYRNSVIPFYQIGSVPSDQIFGSGNDNYVGCPDVCGNTRNLAVFLNNSGIARSDDNITISACAYASLIIMMSQITEYNQWNYCKIFYRYSNFLFKKIQSGSNDRYSVSDFRDWNPCTGLGILDGSRLTKLLKQKFVLTGFLVQISSTTISQKMSFLNFYPIPPLEDPLSIQPEHDRYNSLVSFGPQSLWSALTIYKVDPSTGTVHSNPENRIGEKLVHGDTIIIVYHTGHYSNQDDEDLLILECFNATVVRTHTYSTLLFSTPIDIRYRWNIIKERADSYPIVLFDRCKILPSRYQRDNYCRLSSHYSNTSNLFSSSPSLLNSDSPQNDGSDIFELCPHYYQHLAFVPRAPIDSYFVNLTNYKDFWSCGIEITEDSSSVLLRLRDNAASTVPPFVQYVSAFDPYPQWLLIPMSIDQTNTFDLVYGDYMIFNTRLRAYVFFDRDNAMAIEKDCLRMLTVNYSNTPLSRDLLPYCVFTFSPIQEYRGTNKMFSSKPIMNEPNSPSNYNTFLCPLQISFRAPYYKDNGYYPPNKAYTKYISTESFTGTNFSYVQVSDDCPPESRATSFCFHIHPKYLISSFENVIIYVPQLQINLQTPANRFINHAIASPTSNSYVQMIPRDEFSMISIMTWIMNVKNTIKVSETSNSGRNYPITQFNNPTYFELESYNFRFSR